jgi:hypothetical protein
MKGTDMNALQRLALCAVLLGALGAVPATAATMNARAASGPATADSIAAPLSAAPPAQDEPVPYEPGPHGC